MRGGADQGGGLRFWSVRLRGDAGVGGVGEGVLASEDLSGREVSVRHAALVECSGATGNAGGSPAAVSVWQRVGSGEARRVCTLRAAGRRGPAQTQAQTQAQVRLGPRGQGLVYDAGNPVRFYAEGGQGRWDVQLLGTHDTRAHDSSDEDVDEEGEEEEEDGDSSEEEEGRDDGVDARGERKRARR